MICQTKFKISNFGIIIIRQGKHYNNKTIAKPMIGNEIPS